MASKISSALPAHLKPSGASNGEANGGGARKHHGKSQSHMVSSDQFLWVLQTCELFTFNFLEVANACSTLDLPLRALRCASETCQYQKVDISVSLACQSSAAMSLQTIMLAR